jgi:hypothetical protein
MIARNILRAFVPCLLLAVAPMLLHCGADAMTGTETGNPPGIIQQKLYLEQVADGIRVVGRSGAISPLRAAVRVTNVSTGVSVETIAAADGSLDVVVAGAAGDELEVTVTSGGQQLSERISFAEVASRSDLGGISCEALESTLNENLNEVFESADTSCSSHADCALVGWSAGADCFSGCGIAALSTAGAADVQAIGEQRTAPVCAALEVCQRQNPPSCGGGPGVQYAECREGQCQGVDPSMLSCIDLFAAANERRATLLGDAGRRCSVDADCGLASVSVECLRDCGEPVSVSQTAVQALEDGARREVDSGPCQALLARSCPLPDGLCPEFPGPPEPFCDAGACAIRYVP